MLRWKWSLQLNKCNRMVKFRNYVTNWALPPFLCWAPTVSQAQGLCFISYLYLMKTKWKSKLSPRHTARKCLVKPPSQKRTVAEMGHQTGLGVYSYMEGPIIFPLHPGFKVFHTFFSSNQIGKASLFLLQDLNWYWCTVLDFLSPMPYRFH